MNKIEKYLIIIIIIYNIKYIKCLVQQANIKNQKKQKLLKKLKSKKKFKMKISHYNFQAINPESALLKKLIYKPIYNLIIQILIPCF